MLTQVRPLSSRQFECIRLQQSQTPTPRDFSYDSGTWEIKDSFAKPGEFREVSDIGAMTGSPDQSFDVKYTYQRDIETKPLSEKQIRRKAIGGALTSGLAGATAFGATVGVFGAVALALINGIGQVLGGSAALAPMAVLGGAALFGGVVQGVDGYQTALNQKFEQESVTVEGRGHFLKDGMIFAPNDGLGSAYIQARQ